MSQERESFSKPVKLSLKLANTPMDFGIKLTSVVDDELFHINMEEKKLTEITSYRRLIGKLLYLNVTRPHISFSVQQLSQYMQYPKLSHWNAASRIVKYVKDQPSLGLFVPSKSNLNLTCYCD